jgi:hypothetical protein
MAYEKTEWKAREGVNLNKFTKSHETEDTVILLNTPDEITEHGTPFSTDNMNKIEQGIYKAHENIIDTLNSAKEYTDQTSAAFIQKSEIGVANGIATLGPNGTVPISQLPSANGILVVSHDNSLEGEGTYGNPLGIKFPIIVPSKSGEVSNEPTLLATEAQVYDTIDILKNMTSIVSLTEDNRESELAAIYGGIWHQVTFPAPRTLHYVLASGDITINNVISGNNYYLENIGQGALVTVEVGHCGSYTAELISTTRGIIQTQSVVSSGTTSFNSVTIQADEHLYVCIKFSNTNSTYIRANWTIEKNVTEYIYFKEQEIKHEII